MQKRFPEAADLFQEVVSRSGDNREARWLLGVALFRGRKAHEALPHLRAAVSDTDPEQLELLAQCEHFLGHHSEAEAHVLRAIDLKRSASPETVALLGSIQGELDPNRARATLSEALGVYPRSSPIRYELIRIEIDTGNFDVAIELASEGHRLNERDAGSLVGRAEAKLRRAREEDKAAILDDLDRAETLNRRDANLYRIRGELYLRRATRTANPDDRKRSLRDAVAAYDAGIGQIKPGWLQAALLASKSRVLLLLEDFGGAEAAAKAAVEVAPGHVSNHIALALARLAASKWEPAVIAAGAGQNVGGWAGRVVLTAVEIIGHAMSGVEPADLVDRCKSLADELENTAAKFTPSESWEVVKQTVLNRAATASGAGVQLVGDTVFLLDDRLPVREFRGRWAHSGAYRT